MDGTPGDPGSDRERNSRRKVSQESAFLAKLEWDICSPEGARLMEGTGGTSIGDEDPPAPWTGVPRIEVISPTHELGKNSRQNFSEGKF